MAPWRPAALGVGLAVLTMLAASWLGPHRGLELLAAILVAAGAVYPGAALAGATTAARRLEVVVGVGFMLGAVIGLWLTPVLVAAGYLLHGVWDFLHHPRRVGAQAGAFFPPFCLVYDELVGVFVLLRYGMG